MAPNEFVEIRLVCKADYLDPELKLKLHEIKDKLREILHTGRRRFALKKVQPWNSVKVTFDIPKEAADRLRLLAVQGNVRLIELGILSVEIGGQSNAIVLTKTSSSNHQQTTNSIDNELETKTTDDHQHRNKRMKIDHESDRTATVAPSQTANSFPRISPSNSTFVSPVKTTNPTTTAAVAAASSSSYPIAVNSNGMSSSYFHPDPWTNYSDSTANNYKMKVNGVVTRTTNNHYYHSAQQPSVLLTENSSQSSSNSSMFCPSTNSTNNPYEIRNTSMPNSSYDRSSTS